MGGDLEDPKFIKSTMSDQNIHVGMKNLRPCRARRANEASLCSIHGRTTPRRFGKQRLRLDLLYCPSRETCNEFRSQIQKSHQVVGPLLCVAVGNQRLVQLCLRSTAHRLWHQFLFCALVSSLFRRVSFVDSNSMGSNTS